MDLDSQSTLDSQATSGYLYHYYKKMEDGTSYSQKLIKEKVSLKVYLYKVPQIV
jgi:hypothetical protein